MRASLKRSVGKARVRIAHPLAVSAKAHAAQRREAYAVRGPQPESAVDAGRPGMTFRLPPLRVFGSSACRRVSRVVAPAGESLSFVASNESNQSKDALHFAVRLRLLPSATCLQGGDPDHGTPVQRTPPLSSLRIAITHDAKRGVDGMFGEAERRIAFGPRGRRRGAQGFGAARASALRQLTSRRLSERSERSERSEFGAGPEHRAPQSSPALAGPSPSGRLFFGDFLLAKQKKVTALSGAHPDAASRSEQPPRKGGTRLRCLSPNGWRHANQASTGSARTGGAEVREPGFDRLSPNGRRCANQASTGSARTGEAEVREPGFDRLSPNGWRYASQASTSSARTESTRGGAPA